MNVRRVLRMLCIFISPVTLAAQPAELFISEYIEGSSLNKAIEIFNGTGAPVNLAAGNYVLEMYFNGSTTAGTTIPLTGVVANNDVFVVADDGADAAILAETDQTSTSSFFNGDDAVVLLRNGAVIDAIGQVGFDPGSQWGSGDVSTQNNTIRRQAAVLAGDTDEADAFDPLLEWDGFPQNTFDGLGSHTIDAGGPATFVRINEVDADNPSTDTLEFVELYDGGAGNTSLDGLVVVFYNGSGDASYAAFDLDGLTTDANGFFLMGNAGVSPAPALLFSNNLLQNGADAVALYEGDASDFPNGTAITLTNLIDAIVYDTNDGDDAGLLTLLNPGQPQVNEGGAGDKDNDANARVPDGGIARNTDTYVQQAPTPGASNVLSPAVVINEVDSDTPGSDNLEFIELYDGGAGGTALDGLVLVLYNGSSDVSYASFDLDGFSTDANGFFLLGNAAVMPTPGLVFGNGLLQNGADAVALYSGDASDFPGGTAVTTTNLVDAIVYDTNDADDAGLLVLLNAGQPQVNEGGGGDKDNDANARVPDGGASRNTDSYVQQMPTPGATNIIPPDVVINEVDSDTPGSDVLEFVELYDGGTGNTPLDGLVVVFFNGSDDASYAAFDLDGFSTDVNGYFLMGNTGVVPTPALTFGNGSLQNGADAVALFVGDASDFPNDTPITTTNLVDAIVYDTDDADDAALLALLNAGQPQVNESGGGNKDGHSNQRFPNGTGGARNTDTFDQFAPTPGAENTGPPPPVMVEIFEIQGSGLVSPVVDRIAITEDNVVTAIASNGFFMQTPTARTDGDPETSDGLFVFTGSAPTVAVGDFVDVTGQVIEFNGLTEISNGPSVTIVSSGNPLPAPVQFDTTTPSPTQPQPANEFERYEGMLIQFSGGRTTAPSDNFGDIPIVAGPGRAFREPGIEFPGLPGLPVWDGNPEIFELNPDGLGLPDQLVRAGAEITSAAGPLTFSFGDYILLPTQLTMDSSIDPVPVRERTAGEFTIGTQNMERLFEGDTDFSLRLDKFSLHIREILGAPDILAVQEIENISTLQALAAEIQADDPSIVYTAYLEEGNDVGGIDIGFLVRTSVLVDSVVQIGSDVIFTFDGSLLHDRPPLLLYGKFVGGGSELPITVMGLHNRSLSGIEGSNAARVKQKRLDQAFWIAERIQELQTADPGIHLVVAGDLNAYQFTDGYVDVVGQITGNLDPAGAELPGTDVVNPDLTNQVLSLPAEERYSFIFQGSAQALDHILTSQALAPLISGVAFGRNNADFPEFFEDDAASALRSSDHDGMVIFVRDPTLANTAVLATNSVWLQTDSHVKSGHVLVNAASPGPTLNSGVELTLSKSATTPAGFNIKANRIKINKDATAASDVFYNTLTNKGIITGAEHTPLRLPLFDALPAFEQAVPGADNITVPKTDTVYLAPGAYGEIILKQESVLIFSGGEYDLLDLDTSNDAKILFGAASKVRIQNRFDVGNNSTVGPAPSAAIDASDIMFYVAGINGSNGSLNSNPKAVHVGKYGTLNANFYAPNGTIMVQQYTVATGAYLAKDIRIGKSVLLVLDSYFANPGTTSSPLARTAVPVRSTAEVGWDATQATPVEFELVQNFPNPFNPRTTIRFELPEASRVDITVFDMLGRQIATLIDSELEPGFYQAIWDGKNHLGQDASSGVYLYVMRAGSFSQVRRMTLVR